MIWAAVALAGALGAVARHLLDWAVTAHSTGRFPWGTVVINATGSFAAGIVTALAVTALLPPELHVVVAGGFLGAYTTFSTAMYETARLLEDGEALTATANLLLPLALAVTAATVPWVLII